MNETRHPLCWPANWPRTKDRKSAQFKRRETPLDGGYARNSSLTVPQGFDRVENQLEFMGVGPQDVIVSTNVILNLSGAPQGGRAEPTDPGVTVYWKFKGKKQCMAIDRYDRVADNLAAVAATLEALRAIERHGGGSILERAFIGFAALPAAIVTPRSWRIVLGLPREDVTRANVEEKFMAMARNLHPDAGGSHEQMVELNAARVAALEELGG